VPPPEPLNVPEPLDDWLFNAHGTDDKALLDWFPAVGCWVDKYNPPNPNPPRIHGIAGRIANSPVGSIKLMGLLWT